MKFIQKFIYLILLVFLLIPFKGFNQENEPKELSNIDLINVAKEMMTAAETCALITLDEEGRPRVRAMDPFIPENDLTVWFGTNANSRKVDQIKKDPRVTLYYLDSDSSGYVMIYGNAQIVDDENEKNNRWKDKWKDFYPNKKDYLLIKVSPTWMEIISESRNIVGDTITWQPPEVLFNSKQ
ncbi:MAG: pyridoxamine 5'-phosphate oxidase family protein [Flavobacteriaceae bacterium]|nr:pyridoxamine 5'-phosphate oxidase family protein [Flavobacteriaceae bacterium]